jgi:hypothetical protein
MTELTLKDFEDMMNNLMPKRKSKRCDVEYINGGRTVMITSDFGTLAMSSESWDNALQEAAKTMFKTNDDEKQNP